ncbi:hypothetical protein A2501_04760 [Candidatus Uhrbacteria bacterium RIFOXYC12_FULL_57_11]|nr:MAG: hypothetical protein A2501_04760 [Candidatus Uhrbacteria bacterium RIFOXYC12_FULL_57_11]
MDNVIGLNVAKYLYYVHQTLDKLFNLCYLVLVKLRTALATSRDKTERREFQETTKDLGQAKRKRFRPGSFVPRNMAVMASPAL